MKEARLKIMNAMLMLGVALGGILMLYGCDADTPEPEKKIPFPTTPEEWAESDKMSLAIAEKGLAFIEEQLSAACSNDEDVDPEVILKKVKRYEYVDSAGLTPDGTGIVIKQIDGTYSNISIVNPSDERWFRNVSGNSLPPSSAVETRTVVDGKYVIPSIPAGSKGKALILAPFQWQFAKPNESIKLMLENIGYDVSVIENENADYSKFKGDFLCLFDVVFISTHGGIDGKTKNGKKTSFLLTASKWSTNIFTTVDNINKYLSDEEEATLIRASVPEDKGEYVAISVPWLKLTTTKTFKDTWVFISACSSSYERTGDASFVEFFLNKGAAAYSGYDNDIYIRLANIMDEVMFRCLVYGGMSFKDATNDIRKEEYSKEIVLRLKESAEKKYYPAINVDLFSGIQNPKYNIPFYINASEMDISGDVTFE
ncbi:MAG: hypothetical protein LBS79_10725, partial [Tannerella sp.]|nr:hypothetical protein [Tannerella sp.]